MLPNQHQIGKGYHSYIPRFLSLSNNTTKMSLISLNCYSSFTCLMHIGTKIYLKITKGRTYKTPTKPLPAKDVVKADISHQCHTRNVSPFLFNNLLCSSVPQLSWYNVHMKKVLIFHLSVRLFYMQHTK